MSAYDEKKKLYKMLSDQYATILKAKQADTGCSIERKKWQNTYFELEHLKTFIGRCREAIIPADWYLWAKKRLDTIDTCEEYLSD